MIKKLHKYFWGIVLVPLTCSTLYNFPILFSSLRPEKIHWIMLFSGMFLYLIIELIFQKPIRTYVFGHELTHAIAALLSGGKVHSFKVSKRGGSVSVSKTNFFIALSPYCIPIYTFFIILIYFLSGFWIQIGQYQSPFLFLVGLSFAFHISLTLFAIRQNQPDIKKTGVFFSAIFIILINSWIIVLLSKILFWDLFSLKNFFIETLIVQLLIWKWIFLKLKILLLLLGGWIKKLSL